MFGCAGASLLWEGFSLVMVIGGYSLVEVLGLLLLWSMGSRAPGPSSCGSWAPEHRLSITWA